MLGYQPDKHGSNIKLLTWDQFQEYFFERWLSSVSYILTYVFDKVYELTHFDEDGRYLNRVAYFAARNGGTAAWEDVSPLETRYVGLSLASSLIGGAGPAPFVKGGQGPSLTDNRQLVRYDSPREYYDAMLQIVPKAYNEFVEYLLKYTDGICGSAKISDKQNIWRIERGVTKKIDLEKLIGRPDNYLNWLRPEEVWRYRSSKTVFKRPRHALIDIESFEPTTEEITIEIAFSSDGTVKEVLVDERQFNGLPE
jgi:hypothetical protein